MIDTELARLRERASRLRDDERVPPDPSAERDRLIDDLLSALEARSPSESTAAGIGEVDLLQAVIDAIPAAITLRDPEGRYLLVNTLTPVSAGLSVAPETFIGKTFAELQPLGAASEHVRGFEQVIATGQPVLDRVYESAVTPGRYRQMSAMPLHDPTGNLAGVLTIGLDVTDRERAQRALHESERRMSALIDNLPGAAYRARLVADAEHELIEQRIEFISEGCVELLGFSAAEIVRDKRDLRELVVADDRGDWARRVNDAYKRGERADLRVRVARADGAERWILHRSRVVERFADALIVEGLMVDIHAQVRTEAALAQRQALLQTVIDTVPETGITMSDARGRYQFINAFAIRQHGPGFSAEDFIGKHRDEIKSARPLTIPGRTHDEVLATGKPIIGRELESEARAGEWRQLHAAPVRGVGGTIDGVVQVYVDITRLKHVEHDLQRHRDQLEDLVAERTAALLSEINERKRAQEALARNERLAAVGQVAATVSHELRNPLGTIQSSLFVLDNELGSRSENQQRVRDRIERNIERCVRIIEQMLDFTRMRALDFRATDLERWCRDVVAESVIPERVQVSLDLDCPEPVEIDGERMRHALTNVLQNACQAMMEAEQCESPRLTVKARAFEESVEIAVSDSGPGIDPDVLDKIFEPLYSTRPFGVGLGLPLVKRLVEEHDGQLELESAPGVGTTVSIRVPRQRP